MDIREIIYVCTIADHGNLTRAADALHITQPSLSQSIRNIEHVLGFDLFIRSKKGMALTEKGQHFVKDAQDVLEAHHQFEDKIASYKILGNTYHIGFFKLIHTTPINTLIMSYIAEHTQDSYTMKIESIPQLESMVASGQLDMAFIKYSPIFKRDKKLHYTSLYRQRLCVLLSKNNPLIKHKTIDLSDLKGTKLLTSDPSEYPYQMIEHIMKRADMSSDILLSTDYANMNIIMDFVSKNLGVTFATEDVCRYYESDQVGWVPLEVEYYYELCLVQRKSGSKQAYKAIGSYLLNALTKK